MDGEILNILNEQGGEDELSDMMRQRGNNVNGNPGIHRTDHSLKVGEINSQLEDAFANDRDPNPDQSVKTETYRHRLIIYLAAGGHSIKSISEKVKMSRPYISQILRQPWARRRLIAEIQDNGRDVIKTILEPAAHDALLTIIDLSQNGTKEDTKLRASQELLDRFLGKSTQVVQASVSNLDKLTDEQLEAIANRGRSGEGRGESSSAS